ncbi:MAG: carbohydrate kinase [Thermosipho sp. (in: Bacteria)]|nr:carbohydrate kinase [Thermosipho sp. (in: thermotogales)]
MILCAGESLIDLIGEEGKGIKQSEYFKPRIGGSPLNVVIGLSRLGKDVAFLTKVGDDYFGEKIKDFLITEKVKSEYIFIANGKKTPLAFVALSKDKVPEYEFYRQNTADLDITDEDIQKVNLDEIEIFHFGSISLIEGRTAESLISLFYLMKEKDIVTSLDPNVRNNLIPNIEEYKDKLLKIMKTVDILKLSEEDLKFFLPNNSFDSFVEFLERKDKITFLTLGKKGSLAYFGGKIFKNDAKKFGTIVDTTGCGDAYMAAILYKVSQIGYSKLREDNLYDIMNFASVVAGIVATKYGGASSMPRKEDLGI